MIKMKNALSGSLIQSVAKVKELGLTRTDVADLSKPGSIDVSYIQGTVCIGMRRSITHRPCLHHEEVHM